MGWALKKQKSSSRFPGKDKAYLDAKFLIGEETGNKESPTQVAREMRRQREREREREREMIWAIACLLERTVSESCSVFLSLSSNKEETQLFNLNCRQLGGGRRIYEQRAGRGART